MDAVGVLARFPCVLSETPLSRGKNGAAASHGRAHSVSFQSYRHLTAFQPSPFLSLSSSCRHAGTIRSRRTKTRIFLPHLVAAMEGVEETYIMIKPDGVQRGLVRLFYAFPSPYLILPFCLICCSISCLVHGYFGKWQRLVKSFPALRRRDFC
ncbi:hypothetical protein BHE74_00015018 [Ensete ventricosum]|uniref:Uncharacterized protein n=1 Tax=Ensete ventricosum TaxID=4639 RepID=A0A445MGD2_ENSVE|nr:hypothetical protein BHE74_00015018 [Ensete ventricosum]RZR73256.1 hypothetical protein BHM03_00021910 [Ensete ventricosum]